VFHTKQERERASHVRFLRDKRGWTFDSIASHLRIGTEEAEDLYHDARHWGIKPRDPNDD
jgi:hypothetical protein